MPKRIQIPHNPTTIITTPKLTLRQLARLTPRNIQENAGPCRPRPLEVVMGSNAIGVFKKVRFTTTCIQDPHIQTVQLFTGNPRPIEKREELLGHLPTDNSLWNSPVWVSCDCEYWMFTCEFAVARYGSTAILYCNGEPPVMTNPKMMPRLCKHLFHVAHYAVKAQGTKYKRPGDKAPRHSLRGPLPRGIRDLMSRDQVVPSDAEVDKATQHVRRFIH